MIAPTKILSTLAALGLSALGLSQTNVALGKPVVGYSDYYNSGTETFPASNITDGRLGDTGAPSNWSFWLTPNGTTGYATRRPPGPLLRFVVRPPGHPQSRLLRPGHGRLLDRRLDGRDELHDGRRRRAFSLDERNNLTLKTDALAAPVVARYVRFDILSDYGSSGGLNELQVFGQPTPEPAPLAALGLGALGLLRRRRRPRG